MTMRKIPSDRGKLQILQKKRCIGKLASLRSFEIVKCFIEKKHGESEVV